MSCMYDCFVFVLFFSLGTRLKASGFFFSFFPLTRIYTYVYKNCAICMKQKRGKTCFLLWFCDTCHTRNFNISSIYRCSEKGAREEVKLLVPYTSLISLPLPSSVLLRYFFIHVNTRSMQFIPCTRRFCIRTCRLDKFQGYQVSFVVFCIYLVYEYRLIWLDFGSSPASVARPPQRPPRCILYRTAFHTHVRACSYISVSNHSEILTAVYTIIYQVLCVAECWPEALCMKRPQWEPWAPTPSLPLPPSSISAVILVLYSFRLIYTRPIRRFYGRRHFALKTPWAFLCPFPPLPLCRRVLLYFCTRQCGVHKYSADFRLLCLFAKIIACLVGWLISFRVCCCYNLQQQYTRYNITMFVQFLAIFSYHGMRQPTATIEHADVNGMAVRVTLSSFPR